MGVDMYTCTQKLKLNERKKKRERKRPKTSTAVRLVAAQ